MPCRSMATPPTRTSRLGYAPRPAGGRSCALGFCSSACSCSRRAAATTASRARSGSTRRSTRRCSSGWSRSSPLGFPTCGFRWYQKGSEQVAARLTMELEAGGTPCDLLMTSDPFYYAELKDADRLLAYESPAARDVPEDLRDPDDAYVDGPHSRDGARRSTRRRWPRSSRRAPSRTWPHPRTRGLVSMGDPLKSGTTFTTVASLARSAGWSLLEGLGRQRPRRRGREQRRAPAARERASGPSG